MIIASADMMLVSRSIRLAICLVVCVSLLEQGVHVNAKPFETKASQCVYQSCNKARTDALNVHLVPHSHDDVGWLKTVDQYFTGTKTNIQRANVNAIISSVVLALKENPERRFIQVETAFFHQWWSEQNDATKKTVHELVENGQLQFTGGAWSMNDEAAVHYQAVIDQFTFGLKFLNETFGECARPMVGWQIDPFGHSSEMASIFAHMGYDGVFFARVDWRDKMERLNNKKAEMIWQGSNKLGASSNIFTSLLYNHYSAPSGFCFDVLCQEDPIVTDERNSEYNFKSKVENFNNFIRSQASHYKTNNIIITMGDDFNYQDAVSYYRNMDKLIEGFKLWPQKFRDQDINLFYSTPACYVKAVNDAVNSNDIELPLETYDFFPYASDYNSYWSGYYTSRPASKRSEKSSSNLLQIHKQLATFTRNAGEDEIVQMQKSVGIMQHHDAITGTEKQHVANDYARIMDEAFKDSEMKINGYISKLLSSNSSQQISLNLKQCLLKNETICAESTSDTFTVVVYNPLVHKTKYPVRFPVNSLNFVITGPNDESVNYQISDSIAYEEGKENGNQYELTFIAELDALGLKVYNVKKSSTVGYEMDKPTTSACKCKLGGIARGVNIDSSTGLLESVTINGKELKVRQELLYYLSAQGDNSEFSKRSSGAYIFRNLNGTVAQQMSDKVEFTTYKGEIYDEIHQVFSDWAKQTIRVYHDEGVNDNIEFEWYVGPIPVDDEQGKEVISRFTTELQTGRDFYTDSNGREMIHRIRDFRPTYTYTNEEPIAGNYHPVTAQITITDGTTRLSVLNDRSQGGTSLESGQVEVMVHRRMLRDDAFGVGEALNEKDGDQGLKVRGRHYLTITTPETQIIERRLANRISMEPWVFFDSTSDVSNLSLKKEFTALKQTSNSVDEVVKLLTLEPILSHKSTLLIRLENFCDWDDKKQVTVNLEDFFVNFDIMTLEEVNLAGNILKDRLAWNQYPSVKTSNIKDSFEVTLKPFEIKTFKAIVNYKSSLN